MHWFRFLLAPALIFLAACQFHKPTPLAIGDLIEENNKAVALYVACERELIYDPATPGCEPDKLEAQLVKTRAVAVDFIAQDPKQPHGFDVYLKISQIYFKTAQRAEEDFTLAELIAKQFFKTQQATGGHSETYDKSVLYWAERLAESLADELIMALDHPNSVRIGPAQRAELLECVEEATGLIQRMPAGAQRRHLYEHLDILHAALVLL